MKILSILLLILIFAACQSEPDNIQNTEYQSASPPKFLGEPVSSAGTSLLTDNDGSILFIYRNGDWDLGGFSDTVSFIRSIDEGRTWMEPKPLVITPGRSAQCFTTISPQTGEIILFYIDRGSGVKVARSSNNRKDWSFQLMNTPDKAPINTISYANALWIDHGNSQRVICGFHVSDGTGCGTFYSDDDGKSWNVSPRIKVPNNVPNIWQTGAVEPSIVELRDGRLMMFIRNSNFNIWKSYSTDKGENWSDPVETDLYCGDNSWITLKNLTDGRIALVWNNAKALRPEATLDKWNFTSREVLHMAISGADGESWTGFRELMLDRLRDGGFINHPGDKGLNESKLTETTGGKILMALGQAPGHRSFLLVDPDWLYQKERHCDFPNGLADWSRQKLLLRPSIYSRLYHHNFERKPGAVLADHPDLEGRKVLHIRRPKDTTVFSQRDGAVWNFPAGTTGSIETKIRLITGFKGASISLNDRWFQPCDNQGRSTAMFVLDIPANGKIAENVTLEKDQWYTLQFNWNNVSNPKSGICELHVVETDDHLTLPMHNISPHGISYLRFRSASRTPDNDGMLVEEVYAKIE